MCLKNLFGRGKEKSPSDWLPREAITAANGNVAVDLSMLMTELSAPPKVWIPPVPATGSMLPNFSHEHNNILIAGANEADHQKILDHLQAGDIAVYRVMVNPSADPHDFSRPDLLYAIHRIVRIDSDDKRRYFIFKGDNNSRNDPYRVRDRNLLWVSIGTIF